MKNTKWKSTVQLSNYYHHIIKLHSILLILKKRNLKENPYNSKYIIKQVLLNQTYNLPQMNVTCCLKHLLVRERVIIMAGINSRHFLKIVSRSMVERVLGKLMKNRVLDLRWKASKKVKVNMAQHLYEKPPK